MHEYIGNLLSRHIHGITASCFAGKEISLDASPDEMANVLVPKKRTEKKRDNPNWKRMARFLDDRSMFEVCSRGCSTNNEGGSSRLYQVRPFGYFDHYHELCVPPQRDQTAGHLFLGR